MSKKLFTVFTVASITLLSACESNNVKPDVKPELKSTVPEKVQSATQIKQAQQNVSTASNEIKKEVVKPKSTVVAKPYQAPVVKSGSDPRMAFASNLIYRSTAAKQIQKSGDSEAKKLYQMSQNQYQQALKETNPAKSKVLLDQALKNMFTATKNSEPSEVRNEKLRNDFTIKKTSVSALLDAHSRVSTEKNKTSQGKQIKQQITLLLNQADALYKKEEYSQGRGILDGALNIVKGSIQEMRGGDTLVKTLKFDSPQDEYMYELDRNDTHQMLIKVLLKDKRKKSPDLDKRVIEALSIAGNYRQQAEKSAQSGDHKAAVSLLEKSTQEMVKVIRRGGIYIPSA